VARLAATADEEADAATYCHYLPIAVNGHRCYAMVDSGNTWRSVMSLDFFEALGLDVNKDLRPVPDKSVGTAKKGVTLDVVGELSEPVKLQFGSIETKFNIRPIVVSGLAMPFNISGPYMQSHSIDQLHSENCIRIQGRKVKLVSRSSRPPTSPYESDVSNIYLTEDTVVPPYCSVRVAASVAGIAVGHMDGGDGIVRGGRTSEDAAVADLHPWLNALVTADLSGRTVVGLMNSTDEPIKVVKGTKYGDFTRMVKEADAALHPHRVCEISASPTGNKVSDAATIDDGATWDRPKRRAWLAEHCKIDSSPVLTSEAEKKSALDLLEEFWDIFSVDGSYGRTDLMQHHIYTGDHPPIKTRNRPVNPGLEGSLRVQLDKWLTHDVVEPSTSSWSFALVAAPKKGPDKVRWCVDFRRLNDVTQKDSFPLPHIGDNLNRLSRSSIFSGIDGAGAFHVVEIHYKDKPKTAFSTPFGLFQFKRMPFGLCNAPATYSRLVQLVLQGIPMETAIPYIDDCIVHSRSLEEHSTALRKVLSAYRKAGLKLQPSKCAWFRDQVEYLGHVVSREGVATMPAYIEAVKDWPIPTTKTTARAFLGKTGYYRRYIKDYAKLAAPWTSVTGKTTKEEEKIPLDVTEAMKESFAVLKKALISAPILAYPQFDGEPFILDTDWSQDHRTIGAVLSQVQDGKERVICYGAKKLSLTQANYSPTKGELWAALYFMRLWRYYLQHRPFLLRTDHHSLQYLHTMEAPTGVVQRWLEALANYPFKVQYRPGPQHGNADALSRIDHAKPAGDAPDETIHFMEVASEGCSPWHQVALLRTATPDWTKEEVRRQQEEDEVLKIVRAWVRDKTDPPNALVCSMSTEGKIYAGLFEQLAMDSDEVLVRREGDRPPRVCLPSDMRDTAITYVHELGAHQGVEATLERLSKNFYFPGIKREVAAHVASCLACQAKKRPDPAQRGHLESVADGYPFQRISIDHVGPLPESRQGNKYILTVKDTFSKWLEAFPVASTDAESTIKKLEKDIFCRFGVPEQIHSDNGTAFTSKKFAEMAKELSIKLTTTPTYNPKSNPVERSHRDLGNALRAVLVDKRASEWEDALPWILHAFRTRSSSTTKLSPFQLLFGRDAAQSLDHIVGSPPQDGQEEEPQTYQVYARKLRLHLERAQEWARLNISKAITRQRRHYDGQMASYESGDLVWLFTPVDTHGAGRKLATFWSGPWTVQRQVTKVLYHLLPHHSWVKRGPQTVSVDRIKAYKPPQGQTPIPPDASADLAMKDDEFCLHWDPTSAAAPSGSGFTMGADRAPPPPPPRGATPGPPPRGATPAPPGPPGAFAAPDVPPTPPPPSDDGRGIAQSPDAATRSVTGSWELSTPGPPEDQEIGPDGAGDLEWDHAGDTETWYNQGGHPDYSPIEPEPEKAAADAARDAARALRGPVNTAPDLPTRRKIRPQPGSPQEDPGEGEPREVVSRTPSWPSSPTVTPGSTPSPPGTPPFASTPEPPTPGPSRPETDRRRRHGDDGDEPAVPPKVPAVSTDKPKKATTAAARRRQQGAQVRRGERRAAKLPSRLLDCDLEPSAGDAVAPAVAQQLRDRDDRQDLNDWAQMDKATQKLRKGAQKRKQCSDDDSQDEADAGDGAVEDRRQKRRLKRSARPKRKQRVLEEDRTRRDHVEGDEWVRRRQRHRDQVHRDVDAIMDSAGVDILAAMRLYE
jgi:transposase InsO family protein